MSIARADIYALGCVAYFLLTGTLVFPDENPMSMALKQVQQCRIRRLSRTEMPIAPDLERVVLQCLEKKPGDRPPTRTSGGRFAGGLRAAAVDAEDAAAWWERHLPPTSTLRTSAHAADAHSPDRPENLI